MGENTIVAPLAAVASAIRDAVGVRLRSLPMSSPKVLAAILANRPTDGRAASLRLVRADDTERFIEYFAGLSTRSRYFFHPFKFERTSAVDVTGDSDAPDTHRVVAVVERDGGESIVGYVWLTGIGGPEIPMLGIGIVDAYQEYGIGRRLLHALLDVGRKLGVSGIRLGVFDDNPRAIHVYESVGFRVDTTKPIEERGPHKEVYMVCDLR